jgi:hypothetical protein
MGETRRIDTYVSKLDDESMSDGSGTPRLVAALDSAWAAIRARHPEVPEVVITLGSGAGPGTLTLGHFHAGAWQRGDDRLPELFVGGESLVRGASDVLGTLLHEAVHGLADARGIRDTSRQGRYHNIRFCILAAELGLEAEQVDGLGFSVTTVTGQAAALYTRELAVLTEALVAWRHPDASRRRGGNSNNGLAARCPCGRRIRVAAAVLAAAPITCGACGGDFTA